MVNCELGTHSGQRPWARKAKSAPAIHNSLFTIQIVRVTMWSSRGLSGFKPFTSASKAAKICPGTM